MKSVNHNNRLLNHKDRKAIDRRAFISKSARFTTSLALLAGVNMEMQAEQEKELKAKVYKELEEKAEKFMLIYGNCARSSFAALNAQFDLKADRAIAALKPFAGGIAGKRVTCGAVTGSLLALGYFLDLKKKSDSAMRMGALFFERFAKEFGSTSCKDVVKHQYGRYYDFSNPEEEKLFIAEALKSSKCTVVVQKAIMMISDIFLGNT